MTDQCPGTQTHYIVDVEKFPALYYRTLGVRTLRLNPCLLHPPISQSCSLQSTALIVMSDDRCRLHMDGDILGMRVYLVTL